MNNYNSMANKRFTFSSYLSKFHSGWQQNWDKDSLLFSSPDKTLVGSGIALSMEVNANDNDTISEQVDYLLQQAKKQGLKPIVIGALAFDGQSRSRFIVPKIIEILPSRGLREVLVAPVGVQNSLNHLLFHPEPEIYMAGVEQAITQIKRGSLEKVVLARMLELRMNKNINISSILDQLMCQTKSNYVFSLPPLPENGQENSVFLGASPELLVKKQAGKVCSNPLAGSIASAATRKQNALNKQRLLQSKKDRCEHEFARRSVAEILHRFCHNLEIPATPDVISAGAVMHLSTRIKGTLKMADTDSLTLAQHLHPTPAVCGTPTAMAKQAINEIEQFNRGLYSGMVGWCDDKGDGEWAVTLRCAEVNGDKARLFSGAGIVEASSPKAELQETNTKLKTMLNVLGINDLSNVETKVAS